MKRFIFVLLICFLSFYGFANAEVVLLVPNSNNVSISEEFYVDIYINTEGASINAIESNLNFDEDILEFSRFDNSQSIITHWISSKIIDKGSFQIAGVTPNGFSGFLNEPSLLNRGNIGRAFFIPKKQGTAIITFNNVEVARNDGMGTLIKPNSVSAVVQINSQIKDKRFEINDANKPTLEVKIVKDELLYNGENVIIFNAIDKETGIKGVYIKSKGEWIRIDSPYSLESNKNIFVKIKAVDFADNEEIHTLFNSDIPRVYLFIFLILIAVVIVVFKKNAKNKIFKIK